MNSSSISNSESQSSKIENPVAAFIKHLRWEAFSLALLMVVLVHLSSVSLWAIPTSFLLFDAGMIGYLKDKKTGALFYNVTHNSTIPTLLVAYGLFKSAETVAVIGFLWTFHIAVDRMLGFGLKHPDSFHKTHLGLIKKTQRRIRK